MFVCAPLCLSGVSLLLAMAESDMQERIRRLEEEVKALRAEVVLLRRERETPRGLQPSVEEWKTVTRRRSGGVVTRALPSLPTSNAFSALQDECKEDDSKSKADAGTLPSGRCLVVGDSQVRYLDREFCSRDRRNRTRWCFPGAGVQEVSQKLDRVLAGEGPAPTVIFSAGGNDIEKVRSVELRKRFREALERVRSLGGVPVVCGVLPRRYQSRQWYSRAIAVNSWLADYCKSNGWTFVDNWDSFFGRNSMLARDGVHLSRKGVAAFAASLEREMLTPGRFFRDGRK